MNITGIGSITSIVAPEPDAAPTVNSSPSPEPGASTSISKPGELLSKLQQLSQQDPEKLKEVASSIAQSIRSAAGSSTDPFLSKLADRFDQVAQTGDVSALQPPKDPQGPSGPHRHHGHHHNAGGSSGVASVFANALDQVNQALAAENTPA